MATNKVRKNPWAGSGFSGTLSPPKVTLTPGAACKHKGKLHGWDRYIQLVAQAYKAAPKKTAEGARSFIALKKHIVRMFKRMKSRVDVVFVDYDPYETAEEMRRAVRDTGVMEISSTFNQSEAFGPEENLMLRAVHDFSAHLGSNPKKKPLPFSLKGELQAYNKHLNLVGKTSAATGALYSEIIGQVCYYFYYGDFPKQKIVTMPDFSWVKIGEVKGYKIVDKDLVRSNPKAKKMATKKPTYKTARQQLHKHLGSKGWKISSPTLKVLWADSPDGEYRVWFKTQGVHIGPGGRGAKVGDAQSMWLDIREESPASFMQKIKGWMTQLSGDEYFRGRSMWSPPSARKNPADHTPSYADIAYLFSPSSGPRLLMRSAQNRLLFFTAAEYAGCDPLAVEASRGEAEGSWWETRVWVKGFGSFTIPCKGTKRTRPETIFKRAEKMLNYLKADLNTTRLSTITFNQYVEPRIDREGLLSQRLTRRRYTVEKKPNGDIELIEEPAGRRRTAYRLTDWPDRPIHRQKKTKRRHQT